MTRHFPVDVELLVSNTQRCLKESPSFLSRFYSVQERLRRAQYLAAELAVRQDEAKQQGGRLGLRRGDADQWDAMGEDVT